MDPKNPTPEPKPADNPTPEKKPGETPASEELKPLTDEEMATMSTEEITAHAEKLETQAKEIKKQTPEQIRENQIQRARKAQEKVFGQTTPPEAKKDDATSAKKEIAQSDLLTLGKTEFDIGSNEQQVLQWYVDNGKVASYKEALAHPAVKAELEALKAESDAATVIDENDTEENQLKTKKEAVAEARATGEVPEDPKVRAAIVEDNLSRMSALN